MRSIDFAGKKITLMGLGLLGRGLGDAKFFAEAGADLIVTDAKTEAELAPSVAALADVQTADGNPAKITFHLGGHRLEDFENRDLIIRAPNAPLDSPFVAHAREHGIPVEMDAALFVKLCGEIFGDDEPTIVGVTGTRGKSTTTQLIYEMAQAAFASDSDGGETPSKNRHVWLGGNVRDTATLPLITKIGARDIVVLELDSWQLQGFAEDRVSPHIAVWTNFMPDHMNYYRGDMERYFADKAAIARFQRADRGDVFIAPGEIAAELRAKFGEMSGRHVPPTALPADWEIALPGEHNRANAACAIAAARALGISDEVIKKVLKNFHGLAGRMEWLGEKNGITFYNDSNATTPDATIAALRTLAEKSAVGEHSEGAIILIAGGSDKELDFAPLAHELETLRVKKLLKKLILFNGAASEKLKVLLPSEIVSSVVMAANMDEAFHAALAAATSGDTILLSPAATSFGIFKNEYERGEQFVRAFENIAKTI